MAFSVLIIGSLICLIAAIILFYPEFVITKLRRLLDRKWLIAATLSRIVFGILFLIDAKATRYPAVTTATGIILLSAGILIPIIGSNLIERWADYWLAKSNLLIRFFALVMICIGAFFIWMSY